jgi:hypothetical protein
LSYHSFSKSVNLVVSHSRAAVFAKLLEGLNNGSHLVRTRHGNATIVLAIGVVFRWLQLLSLFTKTQSTSLEFDGQTCSVWLDVRVTQMARSRASDTGRRRSVEDLVNARRIHDASAAIGARMR